VASQGGQRSDGRVVLGRPPIVHAGIIATFEPSKSVRLSSLKEFTDALKKSLPIEGHVASQRLEIGVDGDANPVQKFESQLLGYSVSNAANTRLVTAELGKFTVAFAKGSYPPWPALQEYFLKFLPQYVRAASQDSFTSVSMRTVSELLLPISDGEDLNTYINTAIGIPSSPEIPDALMGFMTDVLIPVGENLTARVIQKTGDRVAVDGLKNPALQFSLDTTITSSSSHSAADEAYIKGKLELLHGKRNAIFFSTFTDKALEFYV